MIFYARLEQNRNPFFGFLKPTFCTGNNFYLSSSHYDLHTVKLCLWLILYVDIKIYRKILARG